MPSSNPNRENRRKLAARRCLRWRRSSSTDPKTGSSDRSVVASRRGAEMLMSMTFGRIGTEGCGRTDAAELRTALFREGADTFDSVVGLGGATDLFRLGGHDRDCVGNSLGAQ